jgi:lipopolysaccharide/colanic/teichoic acid biosynthesis glycosyltransferase
MRRLGVKPGLTCLWQISGRSNLPFPEQLRLDLKYVEQRCLWLDLKVLLLTIPAVLSADGAY